MSRHTARARSSQDRTSLYQEITDKIVAELEAGRVPWIQPWGMAAAKAPLAMPTNAATGRGYSGINVLILWGAVIEQGFSGQSWLTFRQALGLGGNVRTRLEPDLEDLLWSTVNLFHRAVSRIERELDDNEQAQRRSQKEQDGSEIRSVELERLTTEGQTFIERRNSMEFFRDQAAEQFERHTHSAWRPRSGSKVNHRNLTSAMIDSRDFLAAKRRAANEVLLPAGPKIAVTGGLDFNDHRLIWDKLDRVHAKHPDMVLLHGGSPKGAELIAAKWADHRKVPQIAFKPDWTKHAKAAPFKRNDQMLDVLPIGVMVFPGTGIQDNFADKAKKLGIPVWKFGSGGA